MNKTKHSINQERPCTTTLKINLLSSLFSFVLSCLLLSSVVLSCLSSFIFSSLSLCLLSLSLSLSVSPCDVVCCGVVVCVIAVVVLLLSRGVCLCVLKKPVCGFRHAPVCTLKTSPCAPAPRPHVFQRFLIGQKFARKLGTHAHTMMEPEHAEGPAREGHDLPFGQRCDTGNQDSDHAPTACACGAWRSIALVVEGILERPRQPR